MISKHLDHKHYCCEDLRFIENYNAAINDKTQIWHCHHRLETELNLSVKELKERGLYYDRPASELIFLTINDHANVHNKNGFFTGKGNLNPMYGKRAEDYMSPEAVKEKRRKQSVGVQGKKNGRYHTKQMFKDGEYKTVKYEDIENHLNDGWIIKGKSWTR